MAKSKLPPEEMADQVLELLSSGKTLGDALEYSDQDYEAVYTLGYQLYSQERYLDALKAFGFLVIHNHLEIRFIKAFASALQMLKHYSEAIQFYSVASMMDLSDPILTFHTAECMIPLGMYEEAQQALNIVIRQSEGNKENEPLKLRAEALLALIEKSSSSKLEKKQ